MEPTNTAESYNTDFGKDFYPKGCVYDKEQKIAPGFAGIGCTVSMKALEQQDNFILYNRINKFKADGVNSYFLDCHGMLEAYDDYSPSHPQNIFDDIAIRLKHLDILSKQEIVVGSEGATAYTIPFLSFSHGNFSVLYNLHYKFSKNKKLYGGWAPAKRPAIFFKSIEADKIYSLRYNPKYRIPMFQGVFHESIVTTDRWEIPLTKFINLYQDRFLLEFLYGVPSIWNLDLQAIKEYDEILKQLAKEFTPLHSEIMKKELTHFEYLTDDRMIQKTIFGENEVIIIANFRDKNYENIPPKSLKVIFKNNSEYKIITPEKFTI